MTNLSIGRLVVATVDVDVTSVISSSRSIVLDNASSPTAVEVSSDCASSVVVGMYEDGLNICECRDDETANIETDYLEQTKACTGVFL